VLAASAVLEEQVVLAAPVELAGWVEGIVLPRCPRMGEAIGNTILNIAEGLLIATGQPPIALAGRRAVTHSPTARAAHGSNSVVRAVISGAIAGVAEPA